VVINPAFIEDHQEIVDDPSLLNEENRKKRMPCIVFLDSLKAHGKAQVGKNIRKWLNFEWKRRQSGGFRTSNQDSPAEKSSKQVFTSINMQIVSPRGKSLFGLMVHF
jgi:hypothetical protein